MKIGIISDTHGNIEYLEETAKLMKDEYKIDALIFLGDECEDIENIKNMVKNIVSVPGVYCEHYKNKGISHRIIKEFSGFKVLITHTQTSHQNDFPDDIKPENLSLKDVDMAFYGHTHIPKIEIKNGIIWLNPGHLKKEDKKGFPPSFGIVDFEKRNIEIINFLTLKKIIETDF